MDTLTTLLLATACRSTHHKLAVDALWQIRHPSATAWRNLFLTQYRAYLRGAKAPDDEFKDFRNHVLHVEQNNWGGAVPTAKYWYEQTVAALRSEDWPTAAYNAGVLSHYYSDPHMPFHTGQSTAETNIHRAAEWSVTKSYDQLRQMIAVWPAVEVANSSDWLADMVLDGARLAHPHYDTLVREYDLARGVLDPPRGWNERCRKILAELLAHAIVGFARILERAIDEADVTPPETSPALEVFLATINQPIRALLNKVADVKERAAIEALAHELQTTGKVEEHLPEEQRVIRDEISLYRAQQPRVVPPPKAAAKKILPASTPTPKAVVTKPTPVQSASKPAPVLVKSPVPTVTARVAEPPAQVPVVQPAPAIVKPVELAPASLASLAKTTPNATPPSVKLADTPAVVPVPVNKPSVAIPAKAVPAVEAAPVKYRLELTDLLERAPSIGPKTANRLLPYGWRTVGEFVAADADEVAKKLNSSWAPAATIADWQRQAWLVLQIADLSGTAAQLLVGAGYPTVEEVAGADPTELSSYLSEFVQTSVGQRVLRDGKLPDQVTINRWINSARKPRQLKLQQKSA